MSGSPKYTQAELEASRRRELEAQRRRKAEEERRRREEAAARERARRLEQARGRMHHRADQVHAALRNLQGEMHAQDFQRLREEATRLQQQLDSARTEDALAGPARALEGLISQASEAVARRRREEEERQRRQEIDRLGWQVGETERRLAEVAPERARKFDAAGQQHSQQAIEAARGALRRQDLGQARTEVPRAHQVVEGHATRVSDAWEQWVAHREAALAALGQAEAMLVGLAQDPVTMRWQSAQVAELRQQLAALEGRLEAEAFDEIQRGVQRLLQTEPGLVEAANQAQLQADQRDAIAESVRQALEGMGFFVSSPRAEHPEHPATAMLLEARSAAGKAIGISVPVEGEIWYDVEGYSMTSSPMPGGGQARSCDDAEQVLNDLHRILGESYGVQAGEVMWEGKDPNRVLRKRDVLPTSGQARERGV
jgi:hypothetical protein